MKNYFITLTLILFSLLPAGAVKKFDANPINLAVVLVEKADSANIDGFFKYYGYKLQGSEDGYQIMRHDNGNEIHYSFKDGDISQKHPIIIVKPKGRQKEIDACLEDLKFVKNGNLYERMVNRYNHLSTQCSFEPQGSLVLKRITN